MVSSFIMREESSFHLDLQAFTEMLEKLADHQITYNVTLLLYLMLSEDVLVLEMQTMSKLLERVYCFS